jgi:hypothetical protein
MQEMTAMFFSLRKKKTQNGKFKTFLKTKVCDKQHRGGMRGGEEGRDKGRRESGEEEGEEEGRGKQDQKRTVQ